ncbi:MAG: hypothetical protein D3911_03100 [Candidatus Electrothrix sp. AW3_4]|nr:hypothetical protein [Candidatus Electrothrix gigas]
MSVESVDKQKIRFLAESFNVDLNIPYEPERVFYKKMNLIGNSDKQKVFDYCRSWLGHTCMNLRQGRIYQCPITAYSKHFNNEFGYQIDADKGIDIYSPNISSSDILRQLSKPIETCKWCMSPSIAVPWSRSVANKPPSAANWDAGSTESAV